MRRYMVTVRTTEGTKVESYNDYNDAMEVAKGMAKVTDGVVTIKDNMNDKMYVVN